MHDLQGDWLVAMQSAEEYYKVILPQKKTKRLQEVAGDGEKTILKGETEK